MSNHYESKYGWRNCVLIFILSGIGCNLFSILTSDISTIGCSISMCGFYGSSVYYYKKMFFL